MTDRTLIVAVHDSTDRLAVAHVAESDEERDAVLDVASALGPVWSFDLDENDPLQFWSEP